ncbi:MAG: hypothetical protein DRI30_03875, partial [Chloroflexi bacterium]
LGLVVFAALTVVASADHSWGGYHWAGNKLEPTVGDRTSSSLYDVSAGVTEWADLGSPIQPTMAKGKKGNITVTEAYSPYWLGLAQIFINEEGHITKGAVKLNTVLLQNYPAAAADHVLCQELGHLLGLDHNRANDASPGDDTCMNDQVPLLTTQYTTPNAHDLVQLNAIYGHTDGSTGDGGGGGGGGGGCPPGKPNHPKCAGSASGWVTVHVFWAQ